MRTHKRAPRLTIAQVGSENLIEEGALRLASRPVGTVLVPDVVNVVSGNLVYQGGTGRPPGPTMLRAFLALDRIPADQFADQVAAFVRQWGPLRLCEAHGLPFSHTVARRGDLCAIRSPLEAALGPGTIKGVVVLGKCEAVRLWRPYIRVAATLVRLSGRLHEAERVAFGGPGETMKRPARSGSGTGASCCIRPPNGVALTSAKPKLGTQSGRDAGRSIRAARWTRSGSARTCFSSIGGPSAR